MAWTFLANRVFLLLLIYMSRLLIPDRPGNQGHGNHPFKDSRFGDAFVRWDANWYHSIAKSGYFFEGSQSDVAFFPTFPYLARWTGRLIGNDYVAGIILNHVALFGALVLLLKLARRYLDEDGAKRAVVFMLVFPTSVFFSYYYAEAIFAFACVGALYFYERDKLHYAGLFGMLAASTRLAGILLLPALLFGAFRRNRYRPSPRLAWLLPIAAGLGLVMLVLQVQVHSPLAFVSIQTEWGRTRQFPLLTLYRDYKLMNTGEHAFIAFDLLAGVGVLCAGLYAFKILDPAHGIFMVGSVLLPLASGSTMALERYMVCVVPVYLVLARLTRHRDVERAVVYAFTLFFALHAVLYTSWYWAG